MTRSGIRSRVLLLTILPVVTLSLALSSYFIHTRLADLDQSLRDRGQAIANQLAPASEFGVFAGDLPLLQKLANSALGEPDVAHRWFGGPCRSRPALPPILSAATTTDEQRLIGRHR